jgi:hypothetical protein
MKQRCLYFLNLLSLVLLICIPLSAFAQSEVAVHGEIRQADGKPAVAISVSLMEISMSDQPSIKTIQTVQTDGKGLYRFRLETDKNSASKRFYRVSTDIDGHIVGSDPFRPNQGNQPAPVNLTLPAVRYGFEHLTFPKEVLIIENLMKSVRITSVLYVTNSTGDLVNAKKSPFTRKIPESAFNFQKLGNQQNLEIQSGNGEIEIGMTLMEGTQEIFYSYELAVDDNNLVVEYVPVPGMKEVEFTVADESTEIEIEEGILDRTRVISQQKNAGGRLFRSKIVTLGKGIERFSVTIKGFPLDQSRLFYPAVILLALLLIGFAWYLRQNPSS